MSEINILPPIVYNRLAAGEVVENPASIVKELIENSLDAKAQRLTVQIVNGGIDEIVVTDDGEGVNEADLPKVFLPHATSKIKNLTDIDHINSLGFRGEAMASIAAVAKVEFTSRPRQQSYAVSINEAGEIKRAGSNYGTTVRVANLFYNTPARKKFLRSVTTEKNNITDIIQKIIFANPNVFVRYVVDGKIVIDYAGQGLAAAISHIFAVEQNDLLKIELQQADYALHGYISNIKLAKNNKDRQVLIVNGRVVNGGLPAAVINEVMANYLPVKEYPIFVLQLTVPLDKVDVNVHPQKKEVRFADKNAITGFIRQALTKTLDQYFMGKIENLIQAAPQPVILPTIETPKPELAKFVGKSFTPTATTAETIIFNSLDLMADEPNVLKSAPNILNNIELNLPPDQQAQTSLLSNQAYNVLGQIFTTYLLINTPEALLIIDQHAMAERMNYDKFRQEIDAGGVQSQMLLTPLIVTLTPQEQIKFEQIKPLLATFGFECDLFGESALRVTAIPTIMNNSQVKDFISLILGDKEITDMKLSEAVKHKVATAACKASIKAGDVLSEMQIKLFLDGYFKTKNIPLCPHGRPIMLVYSKNKLESLFARK